MAPEIICDVSDTTSGVRRVAQKPLGKCSLLSQHQHPTSVVLFIGGPEMTAPELISSSILRSRSDRLLRCDQNALVFHRKLQTLGLACFAGLSATSGVAFFIFPIYLFANYFLNAVLPREPRVCSSVYPRHHSTLLISNYYKLIAFSISLG